MTTLMLLSFITASAYDFMVDGLAYNVVSFPDLTCEVTRSDTEYSDDIVIPSTVTYQGRTLTVIQVGDRAFYKCSALTSVEIPNSVTKISSSAFNGCSSLVSVEIPNSVTEIYYGAFYDCSSLVSVEIPNSVTKIGDDAFYGCSSLTSVEIPNSVTKISFSAFDGCSSLTAVEIPNSVTTICNSAFRDCSSLVSVEIPNSVTTIGDSAFCRCTSLTSVEIPNSVTEIGYYAFCDCSSLTSIEIPNSVTTISYHAFDAPIESLIWGSAIDIVFYEYYHNPWGPNYYAGAIRPSNLKYLEIRPSNSEPITIIWEENKDFPSLEKLSLGRSLHYKGYYSFLTCPNLTELELTGYVKYFKIKSASSLTNLTIDNGVELTTGEYGADMSKYDKLECITIKGNVPQFIPTFANAAYLNAKLRVPKGTLQAYQNAEGWKNFWNIEEYDPNSGIDEVPGEVGAKNECGRYDLQGRPVDDTYRGVTIIRYTDGSARKVMTTR